MDELTKKNIVKKTLLGIAILLVAYLAYSIASIFTTPDRNIQQIYLIPDDAAFIIQSSDPVNDWKKFSNSDSWETMKQAKAFEEIARNTEKLDSLIQNNKSLLSLVGKRDLLISIHKVRSTKWEALMVLDMQKVSKIKLLKDQIELILKMSDFTITYRDYDNIPIIEMRDPETRDILYAAFVENHFVASYTSKLLEAAINTRKNPKIGLEDSFIEADKLVAGKGLARLFINYSVLPQFMSIYFTEKNEYLDIFSNSMDYGGFYFNVSADKMETKGYSFRTETADPYVTALLNSGKHTMKAHKIVSARTALYTNIGFNNPITFVQELEKAMSVKNKAEYDSYVHSKKKIENWFGISLEEHFLSWMSGEFALTQSEPGLLGQEPELILAVNAKDIKDAKKGMEFIEKKVKSRSPIKIKTVNYKDFEINYLEMSGFFRLFFGGIFDKFEKPYYTYVEDYVVFSNKPASLLSFIEDYTQKNTLEKNAEFKKVLSYYDSNSTLFLFADVHKFYPQLLPMLNSESRKELQADKEILYSFPFGSMQIVGDIHSASLKSVIDYKRYEPELITMEDPDEKDDVLDENADTEKKQMSELKRFYVEKFQGNVLREFYPEGALKSESEIKEGKQHGRYREYYENGKMKVRGKYVKGEPKGTWKYYTEEGKFDRKEKF
ncbi:DUF3352 domain-containing protein [Bacteroidales bacterium OttesenSCG-928-A17]|nr:DUF3352 domain-containing protein [Bacteroidales bacterium OttesenSCG-928-A17]